MKTKSSPSRYRYCISRLSTLAVSTRTPALKVRSTTLPDITFFSLVRTNAPPLPGLTCWKSTTFHSWPSMLRVMPFLRSFVVATSVCLLHASATAAPRYRTSSSLVVIVRISAAPAPSADDHESVLDPHAAPAGQVDPWLDGDGNPVHESTCPVIPDDRRFVYLQADAVAQPVLEVPAVPGGLDEVPGRRVHVADVGARPWPRPPRPPGPRRPGRRSRAASRRAGPAPRSGSCRRGSRRPAPRSRW